MYVYVYMYILAIPAMKLCRATNPSNGNYPPATAHKITTQTSLN